MGLDASLFPGCLGSEEDFFEMVSEEAAVVLPYQMLLGILHHPLRVLCTVGRRCFCRHVVCCSPIQNQFCFSLNSLGWQCRNSLPFISLLRLLQRENMSTFIPLKQGRKHELFFIY